MTVSELICELRHFNQDDPVCIFLNGLGYWEIQFIFQSAQVEKNQKKLVLITADASDMGVIDDK